jgi:Beta-galactosidase/beta-glucuronidase
MNRLQYYFFCLTLFFSNFVIKAQQPTSYQVKLEHFSLAPEALLRSSPENLSTNEYKPECRWFPVTVPSTVLMGLVQNHIYPDPHIGMNNMLIPDASDSFNRAYHLEQYSYLPHEPNPWKKPYWYRTHFFVPAKDKGKFFQLIFKGINYRADVWLNGYQISDSSKMAGMFAEYSLEATDHIKAGAENILAVKIYPLDFPGLPSPEQLKALGDFYPNGGPTGDIGKNVTMLCSAGWDWIPPVRDRNMGIWQPVYLRVMGNVSIGNARIKTDLPEENKAELSLNLSLFNHSGVSKKGRLELLISPENFSGSSITATKEVEVGALSESVLELNKQNLKELIVQNPHLWWPNGYGRPDLYRIRLRFRMGTEISDDTSFVLGIRTVSSKTVTVNGSLRRDFYVNNKRVHLVGGAWVPDMTLSRDSLRYAYELQLCRNANVNLVRIWGGGLGETDDFYELADRNGLMVWQDFWITGDTQGEFKGSPDWPLQGNVFINNVISTIRRIRNHPSLLVWTGGNEGHARKELYDAMRDLVASMDGTRPFIPSSSGFAKLPAGWKGSWPDDQLSGVYSGGPYAWRDPHEYYRLADKARDWVFKDETGLPSQPPYNTLVKIIPNLTWDTTLPYPLNHTWGYHDACTGAGKYDQYYKEMAKRYGTPSTLQEFSWKMQMMNAIGYQGIFEAAGHKLNDNGGVMLWKLNAAFPSVIWQIYDWYLQPNAGYYFMQNACEPVHIQLNMDDSTVVVVNRTHFAHTHLKAQISIYDMDGQQLYSTSQQLNLAETEVKKIVGLASSLTTHSGVVFVILNLTDVNGKLVSHNVYWLSPDQNYQAMNQMSKASVQMKIQTRSSDHITIQLTNTSKQIAFFITPQLMLRGEEVMPSLWSGNYITLAPKETFTVTVKAPGKDLNNKAISIALDGWNVEKKNDSESLSYK